MTVVIAMANGSQSGRRETRDRICRGPLRASARPGAGEAVAGTAGAVSERKTHPDGEPDVTSSGTVNDALFLVRFFATIVSAPVGCRDCTAARRGRGAAGALGGNRYP